MPCNLVALDLICDFPQYTVTAYMDVMSIIIGGHPRLDCLFVIPGHRPGVAGGGWDDSEETVLPSAQHGQKMTDSVSKSGPGSQMSSHDSDAPTDTHR